MVVHGTSWNLMEPHGALWYLLVPFWNTWNQQEPRWHLAEPYGTLWKLLAPLGRLLKQFKLSSPNRSPKDLLKLHGTVRNFCRTLWNLIEPSRPHRTSKKLIEFSWNPMNILCGLDETLIPPLWNLMEPDKNKWKRLDPCGTSYNLVQP